MILPVYIRVEVGDLEEKGAAALVADEKDLVTTKQNSVMEMLDTATFFGIVVPKWGAQSSINPGGRHGSY